MIKSVKWNPFKLRLKIFLISQKVLQAMFKQVDYNYDK